MKQLHINLENCYGISKLEKSFDFSEFKTFLIYAPNGVMKTSFAKTFKVISVGKEAPHDQIDDLLIPVYEISVDDSGNQINPEEICVIEPYNEKAFESEDKILTLLADEETRKEYLEIYKEIDTLKKGTISSLKGITGSSNYEAEISESFSHLEKKNIFEVFEAILSDIKSSAETFDFSYNDVFDSGGKVESFLKESLPLLEKYAEKYESLVSNSNFFGRNTESVFGTTEAKSLETSLKGDDYFNAGHMLLLRSHGQIKKQDDFVSILTEEIDKIFNDSELKILFTKIDKKLDGNKELRAFKKVIESNKNKYILGRLVDYNKFRQEVWLSFLKQIEAGVESLVVLYKDKRPDLEAIIKKAEESQPRWESAILEFENRFSNMPFKIAIDNKADAILNEKTPAISFKFKGKDIERKKLIESVLSQGEQRAFYLLNIIFEIKSRQLQGQKTLFIIDDIADSFDYKNKYAIVEYLNDLSKEANFYSIILTHNFDFFRTLQSRILTGKFKWSHSFIAERLESKIKLVDAGSRNVVDPFKDWRNGVNTNEKYLIACVPFVRNLIEFTDGNNHDYLQLTHVLHKKEEDSANDIKATSEMCISDLETVFSNTLSNIDFEFENKNEKKIVDLIDSLIETIINETESDTITLEDKIILSIGIRLKAEQYMLSKISDNTPIKGSQTGVLFGRYKNEFDGDLSNSITIKTLESVVIMTPENIHLNSFMYEPILDMGIEELKKLYERVLLLE